MIHQAMPLIYLYQWFKKGKGLALFYVVNLCQRLQYDIDLRKKAMFLYSGVPVGIQSYINVYEDQRQVQIDRCRRTIHDIQTENQKLNIRIEEQARVLSLVRKENAQLKRKLQTARINSQDDETEGKRRYRKRRRNLKKNIKCTYSGCQALFSSDMAYRNHQRNAHNIRKRVNQSHQ